MQHNTRYVVTFVLILTSVVALLLTFLNEAWKERMETNEAIFNKKAILKAVATDAGFEVDDMEDNEVLSIFDNQVEQKVYDMDGIELTPEEVLTIRKYKGGQAEFIDMAKEKKLDEDVRLLPMFIFNGENNKKYYIISVRGNGLWDEIWGNIALENDFTTIAGASFDHKGETPGLGAEIKDNPVFPASFKGKKIYDEAGAFTSVFVRKGGARDPLHEVDGISGATVTADGVSEMMARGIKYYEPIFAAAKNK